MPTRGMEIELLSETAKLRIQSGCRSFGGKTSKRTTTTYSPNRTKPLRASNRERELVFNGVGEKRKDFRRFHNKKPPRKGVINETRLNLKGFV
jgi:hypothetical protein